jgi:hypothetical protein
MICKKCKVDKESAEFYTGHKVCKKCRVFLVSLWKKTNPEKVLASERKRRKERYVELLEYEREWREKNKNKVKKIAAKYRANNLELCRKRSLDWAKRNAWKQKLYRQKHKDKCNLYSATYRKKNLEIVRKRHNELGKKYRQTKKIEHLARKAVYYAVKQGILIKPKVCQICNKTGQVEAHHADYNKPLEVIWVCKECHGAIHMTIKETKKD